MKLQWLKQQKPVTHADKALVYIEKVLAILRQRAVADPEHGAYPRLIPQVEYIKSVLIEPSTDRSKLHTLSFGGGAASETLEREDPELFIALGGVLWIADKIGSGLKMNLQDLEEILQNLSSFTNEA